MEILETIDSINFTTLFILFIGLKFTIETYLKYRNINSIKFMQMAIEYEAARQVELIENGKEIDQETRLFDTKKTTDAPMEADMKTIIDPKYEPYKKPDNKDNQEAGSINKTIKI